MRAAVNCGGGPITVSQVFYSLNPASNCPGSMIDALVVGADFQPGATVRLSRSGHADIHATGVTVQPGGTQITNVVFDLSFAAPGFWQIVVVNPDNGYAVASDLLQITSCP